MDERKVKAIVYWPEPDRVSDLRSFLGLANYYQKFIKNYSKIVAPLIDLLKNSGWNSTEELDKAFAKVKEVISSKPVLKLPDFEKPFQMITDAFDKVVGGVLKQDGHPFAFESSKLKDVEQRHFSHEKEMLQAVHCLREWRVYLLGSKFLVRTDNVQIQSSRLKKSYLHGKQDGSNSWWSMILSGNISLVGATK